MARARASVPPDAIRIEDEVWQEAFSETTRSRGARPRLRSLDGGRAPERPLATRRTSGPVRAQGAQVATVPPPLPPADDRGSEPDASVTSAPWADDGPPARRTVTITGRGADRNLWATEATRRRPARLPHERAGFKPDRVAMWAVFLGVLLVLVAALSGHA
ncbi:MAG TPA: hypothetical protein VGH24_05525 [Solirubrobacteraceae bacterium]